MCWDTDGRYWVYAYDWTQLVMNIKHYSVLTFCSLAILCAIIVQLSRFIVTVIREDGSDERAFELLVMHGLSVLTVSVGLIALMLVAGLLMFIVRNKGGFLSDNS